MTAKEKDVVAEIDEARPFTSGACPYCTGQYKIGYEKGGDHAAVTHTIPACEAYEGSDPLAYALRVRRRPMARN